VSPLHGHEEAVAAIRSAMAAGRLHHAWLVSGPVGIGKSLFARKAALRVLAEGQGPVARPGLDVPAEHQAARLFEAGSHPDFIQLERLAKDGGGTDLARSITVDQVRGLQRLFATTATYSKWRAVVVDAVDDLEPGGANALLKSLEEPPPSTIFLLVSHAPERLLPTIRSRCRTLRLGLLDEEAMAAALRHAVPDAGPAEIAQLAAAGRGSPGRAIAFRGLDVAALDEAMARIARTGDPANHHRTALAQSLAGKAAQARYEAFLGKAPSFIAAAARERRGPALAEALKLWERASELARVAVRQSFDPQATAFEMGSIIAALAPQPSKG
jgi:DNA polymerase III subunit delta'